MKAFLTQQVIRFGDVDPAGIVYFPKIYDFIHQAFEELWDIHVGKRYYHVLTEQRIGFPLVHSEVDFKHPLRFGDRPQVRVTCFKLGHSSIGLRYRFSVDEVECVDARMTVACVRLDGLETIRIPADYRERFEEIYEAPVENR
ncbi:MAG: thioesterase family protein [Planctomycetota bacterium]|nr:thioesterase family protein [Planctomycetota bacterium]